MWRHWRGSRSRNRSQLQPPPWTHLVGQQPSTSIRPSAALPLHDTFAPRINRTIDVAFRLDAVSGPRRIHVFCALRRLTVSRIVYRGVMDPSDIVTLDNLAEKLPPWSPDDESHIYAVVDMGSNGIRFSITDLTPPRSRLLTPVYSTRAAISLFDALTPNEKGDLIFPPDTLSSVAATLSHFTRIAKLHHVIHSNILVFATEAMRRAANAADMLKAIAKATGGLGVHILEPSVETLFGAVMGSRSGLANAEGALFLDLGGGSVQMTWVDTSLEDYEIQAATYGKSMPYGAAKLTRILEEGDATMRATEVTKFQDSLQSAFGQLCSVFPKLDRLRQASIKGQHAGLDVFMCGGGFRGYGSMLMHADDTKPYPIPSVGSYSVDAHAFKQVDKMIHINDTHDGKIFGMSRRRRRQFPAITQVVKTFIAVVPFIRRVTFCKGSNRDGALMMKLPRDIRESNPLERLASVGEKEKPLLDATLRLLESALPENISTENAPTIFSEHLGYLFTQSWWRRGGFDADTNSSFAVRDSICRDSDAPGLTHVARALLGVTSAARWGFSLGEPDTSLLQALEGIITRHSPDAVFWARYIGGLANIIADILCVLPPTENYIDETIRFEATLRPKEKKKDRIELSIFVAPQTLAGIDPDSLINTLDSTLRRGEKKSQKKVFAHFAALQS